MRSGGHRLISVDCHRNGSGCFLGDPRAAPGGSPVDARITIVSGLFPLTCARADELIFERLRDEIWGGCDPPPFLCLSAVAGQPDLRSKRSLEV